MHVHSKGMGWTRACQLLTRTHRMVGDAALPEEAQPIPLMLLQVPRNAAHHSHLGTMTTRSRSLQEMQHDAGSCFTNPTSHLH